uniref:Uncharacterized protein n=1 Tax=Populus davidiana TaxID=266767 RepID=A0A6M2EHI8_9ROSI
MEQAELQTSELKGVHPPASKSESLKRLSNQSSADKRQLKLMVVHPLRATCVSKYHYLKSTISQRPNSTRDQFVVIRDQLIQFFKGLCLNSMLSLQFPFSFSPGNNQFDSFFRLAIVSKMRSTYINHLSEIPFQLRSFRLHWSTPSEITLAYLVKPKSSPNNLQLPVTS